MIEIQQDIFFSKELLKDIIDNYDFFPSHIDYEDIRFGTFKKIANEFVILKSALTFMHKNDLLCSILLKISDTCSNHLKIFFQIPISNKRFTLHFMSFQRKNFKIVIDSNRIELVRHIIKKVIDEMELERLYSTLALHFHDDCIQLVHFLVLESFYCYDEFLSHN